MGSQDDEVLAIFLTKIAIKNSVFIGNLIFQSELFNFAEDFSYQIR
jgi:hypothetical protein